MSDFDTTVKLLNLTMSKRVVATFAGMADLSSFKEREEKLINLCDAVASLNTVPEELSQWTLSSIHNAAKLVKVFAGR